MKRNRQNKADRLANFLSDMGNLDRSIEIVTREANKSLLLLKVEIIGALIETLPDASAKAQKNAKLRRELVSGGADDLNIKRFRKGNYSQLYDA